MPVLFACPYCKTETLVDDAYVGQSGPCVMCGRIVSVPESPGARKVASSTSTRPEQRGNILMLVAVIIGSLLAGAAVLALIVGIVAPAVSVARIASQKTKNAEQLRQIAQAMEQYHVEYGSYPPAYVTDKAGKPMHSWRVLLLPQLGHHDLYRQYDFNQPWDSPTNMSIVTRMPAVYAAPGDDAALASYETSYLVVVGANTAFPTGGRTRNRDEFSDGRGNTILVVEAVESGICWLEPKDLLANKMNYGINSGTTDCIRGKHPNGAMAAFADGKSHFLPSDTAPEFVETLTTINKADNSPLDFLPED